MCEKTVWVNFHDKRWADWFWSQSNLLIIWLAWHLENLLNKHHISRKICVKLVKKHWFIILNLKNLSILSNTIKFIRRIVGFVCTLFLITCKVLIHYICFHTNLQGSRIAPSSSSRIASEFHIWSHGTSLPSSHRQYWTWIQTFSLEQTNFDPRNTKHELKWWFFFASTDDNVVLFNSGRQIVIWPKNLRKIRIRTSFDVLVALH